MLKKITFGFIIYAIIFLVISISLFVFKITNNNVNMIIGWVASVIAAYILAKSLKIQSVSKALETGVIWLIVVAILDYAVTSCFVAETGNQCFKLAVFKEWSFWVGYLLILCTPILAVKKSNEQQV